MVRLWKSDPRRDARKALRAGDFRTAGDQFKILGDYDEALNAYLKGGLYAEAAVLCEEKEDWITAGKYWERARRFRESAEAYIRANKLDEARKMFEMAGDYGRAKDLALQLNQLGKAAEYAARIRQYSEAAHYFYKTGQWSKAAEMADKALADLEKDRAEREHLPEWRREFTVMSKLAAAALFKSGQYRKAGQKFEAAEDYQRALDSYLRARCPVDAVRMAVKLEDYERAMELMERYSETQAELSLCAEVYFNIGRYKDAAKLYMASQKPLMAAKAFEKLGDFNNAAFLYEQSMDYEQATDLYIKANNWLRAAELFKKIGNHGQAAIYYEQAQDFDQAIDQYLTAQRYYDAGRLLAKLERRPEAIALLQKVEKFSPDFEKASLLLARLLIETGRPDVALKRLEELVEDIELMRDDVEVNYLRARALEGIGNLEEAIEAYQTVLAIDVNYGDVAQRLQELQSRIKYQKISLNGIALIEDRYEVLEAMEESPAITLYRAIDKGKNQPVLIKRLRKTGELDTRPLRTFSTMENPNLMPILEILDRSEFLYLCMQYYDGVSLRTWMSTPHTLADVQDIGIQVAEVLSFCHQRDIIFGLLPPESLYITRERTVKLFPWESLLRLKIPELEAYGSPEYNAGHTLNPASDAYCLGVLLYEMVYGARPEQPLLFPKENPVPDALRKIIEHCLQPDPGARPDSLSLVIEALAMVDIFEGTVINNRYKIEKELGRGGMGRVYMATDMVLGEPIAIKLLHGDILTNPKAAQRLVREIKISRKIAHPNVVRVYEMGLFRGARYITMEYVNGVSIQAIIKATGPLDLKLWWKMARQMLEGLKAAHDLGIIHRDLKPQNIIVTREGVVKLLDFGIAHAMDMHELTHSQTVVGSPKYIAPEQVQGQKVDRRADLYSLGLIFYYMLTGKEAFSGKTVKEILMKQLVEYPKPIAELRPETPEPVAQMVNQMIQKEPDARPANCEELLENLDRVRPLIFGA